ncbi:MAG: protein kinase [Desulfobulbaceae bacterium]|nr:protein kinase [Desulfobulbaceae bacterium]
MTIKKLNCWEFSKCGREPAGKRVDELGVCPAAVDTSFDTINSGKNGGRVCWAIAGTFCEGRIQGAFADKRKSCVNCEFFKMVNSEDETDETPSQLLKYLTDTTNDSFLNELSYKRVKAGERFLVQGNREETAYIIQQGTCLAVVEKDGVLHPAGHRGKGDIVGIRALFTGEPRSAHVEAETDLHLWVVNKQQIDNISKSDPELLSLLTEIVARQFDSKRPVADREIGKYVATHIIGRGAYSIVYKAVHKALNMPVAIKMMRHNMVVDSGFLLNLHKEARIIASLNHENILAIYDYEERYKTVFIITEYLEGESLQDLLQRLRVIPPALAISYIYQICKGLAYAHEKGIVHRDINPANVMVLPNDRIKILDFGLACHLGTEDEHIGGVLAYQAPELLEGEAADQRSDMYSLGITAYELITGQKPFDDKEISEMFRLGASRDISDPALLVPDTLPELREFILKACQHEQTKRYQSVPEAIETLRPAISQGIKDDSKSGKRRNLTTVILRYDKEKQATLNRLLADFSIKTNAIGVDLKLVDLSD